jgi:hypothetical protein
VRQFDADEDRGGNGLLDSLRGRADFDDVLREWSGGKGRARVDAAKKPE